MKKEYHTLLKETETNNHTTASDSQDHHHQAQQTANQPHNHAHSHNHNHDHGKAPYMLYFLGLAELSWGSYCLNNHNCFKTVYLPWHPLQPAIM